MRGQQSPPRGVHPLYPSILRQARSSGRVKWHREGVHGRVGPICRRGRENRGSIWWSRPQKRIVEEGVDFIQDTEEGPGEDYIFIRQTDEVGLGNAVLQDSQGEDFVPETQFDDSQIVAADAGNEPNMLGTLVYMHPQFVAANCALSIEQY